MFQLIFRAVRSLSGTPSRTQRYSGGFSRAFQEVTGAFQGVSRGFKSDRGDLMGIPGVISILGASGGFTGVPESFRRVTNPL